MIKLQSITRIWWLCTAAFAIVVSFSILVLTSRNFVRLQTAVMESQKKTLQHAIASDYASLVDDTYLHLNTLSLREKRYQDVLGSSAELKLTITHPTESGLKEEFSGSPVFNWLARRDSVEKISTPLWFGNVYLGLLEAKIQWGKDLSIISSSRNWIDAFIIIFLILALWAIVFYSVNKLIIMPLLEHSNSLAKEAALASFAAQVAHDIRSPLSALNMMTSSMQELSEDRRVLFSSVINRIQDIANSMLDRARAQAPSTTVLSSTDLVRETTVKSRLEPTLISEVLETLVSEKRLLFKSQFQVDISLKIAPSDRLAFVLVPTTELKSALSSLIDNAVEALRGEGSVRVELTVKSGKVLIEVSDNGSGIDSSLLKLLGGKRQTFGKAKGNGLGLYHATSVVRACGGSLDIVSILGEGTKVSVTLPKVLTPAWFADSLLVSEGQEIIILDDDPSIHAIWQERLSVLGYTQNLKIFSFQGIVEFERFMSSAHLIKPLFLLDYELVPSHITGLEIVSRYNLSASAVLVTSRFEDVSVKQRCQELGVRMLPKSIVWFIPLASKSVRLEASCEDVQ